MFHAHLPFVRHPEYEYSIEENWLFEAITETYIPLLTVFENLVHDRVPFRLTMSLTPPLCAMLTDPHLQARYVRHVDKLIELAHKETRRTGKMPAFRDTARMYLEKFHHCRETFTNRHGCDLLTGFRGLEKAGVLELITSSATHAFLPNMRVNENAVRAQIHTAVGFHECLFGKTPRGIWLPECGYYPGLEAILESAGLHFFFVDTHGLLFADPRPRYGTFAPVYCSGTRVAAFGRDAESSRSVWSSRTGYPGDPWYRDFYRDVGFDLDMEYVKPYIDRLGVRIHTGVKYYRVTGGTRAKEPYDRNAALDRAFAHAGDFLHNRQKQTEHAAANMDRTPIVVAPYDAELFGHWWYEGPEWLNYLVRKIAFEQDTLEMITPSEYLQRHPSNQTCAPSYSSWGRNGYSDVWLNPGNDWIYRHLHALESMMVQSATDHPSPTPPVRRTLNQMARELQLAESSDWAFIMSAGTMVDYAVRRTREHIANFLRLHDDLTSSTIDEEHLSLLESHNNIFPGIDYRTYA